MARSMIAGSTLGKEYWGYALQASNYIINRIPTSALAPGESDDWKKAIEQELQNMVANKTWVVTDLPPGETAIDSKWVFRQKVTNGKTIKKYRLVVRGFLQKISLEKEIIGTRQSPE